MNSKQEISKSYSLAAEEYSHNLLNELEQKNFDQIILNWYASQIPKDETILEIGAGPGQISGYLYKQGVNCIGTDISPVMVASAKKNFPNIKFEVQDFFNLSYMDNTFLGVVGFYAIVNYALENIKPIFEEMKRVLKQRGLFLFSFHIFEGEENTHVQKFFNQEGSELTFYYYKVDDIKKLVSSLGFEIVDIIIRYPYNGNEFSSKQSYFILRKS